MLFYLLLLLLFALLLAQDPLQVPALPVVGNALLLLHNPHVKFSEWHTAYRPVFVVRLGSVRAFVVNSFADIHSLWCSQAPALASRPSLHTFHSVVSSTQGPTIGTSPAGNSWRRKRKCIAFHLSARQLALSHPSTIDSASAYIIRSVVEESSLASELSLLRFLQAYVLRCALSLTYGLDINTQHEHRLLADKIIATENKIVNFRSLIANYRDYLPALRRWPLRWLFANDADKWKANRDEYMDLFQRAFEQNLQLGSHRASASILGSIMAESAPSKTLSSQEARSLCLTMVSAGLDNMGFTLNNIFGLLAKPPHRVQTVLLRELLSESNEDPVEAYKAATTGTCTYAWAVLHEGLRHLSVLPLGLPRLTTRACLVGGVGIPRTSIVIMNAFEANHDPARYPDPFEFWPERWIDEDGKLKKVDHLTFGAGARKCPGDILALNEMYIMMCRLILLFHIDTPKDRALQMIADPREANSNPSATAIEPKPFSVALSPRPGFDAILSQLESDGST